MRKLLLLLLLSNVVYSQTVNCTGVPSWSSTFNYAQSPTLALSQSTNPAPFLYVTSNSSAEVVYNGNLYQTFWGVFDVSPPASNSGWSLVGACATSSSSSTTSSSSVSSSSVATSSSSSSSSAVSSSSSGGSGSSSSSTITLTGSSSTQMVLNPSGIAISNGTTTQVTVNMNGFSLATTGECQQSIVTTNVTDQVTVAPNLITVGGCGPQALTTISEGSITTGTLTASTMITTPKWHVPDFVFDKNYKQMPLPEVEKYVQTEHHLPGIPSESEIKKNGLDLSQMNLLLLQKVEEMTLLQIELKKQLDQQNREIKELKEERAH